MLRRTELFSTLILIGYNTDMRAGDNMGPIGSLIDLKKRFARLQTYYIKESKNMQMQQYRNCTNILYEVISTLKMEHTFLGKINFLTGYLPILQKHVKEPPSPTSENKKKAVMNHS